jgi:hypothetical protein
MPDNAADYRKALDSWIEAHPDVRTPGHPALFRARALHQYLWFSGIETGSPPYIRALDLYVGPFVDLASQQRAYQRAAEADRQIAEDIQEQQRQQREAFEEQLEMSAYPLSSDPGGGRNH